jgi:hypothetical protein
VTAKTALDVSPLTAALMFACLQTLLGQFHTSNTYRNNSDTCVCGGLQELPACPEWARTLNLSLLAHWAIDLNLAVRPVGVNVFGTYAPVISPAISGVVKNFRGKSNETIIKHGACFAAD